jgi:hypothetical protein
MLELGGRGEIQVRVINMNFCVSWPNRNVYVTCIHKSHTKRYQILTNMFL